MGCFVACFRSSDDVKRRKQRRRKVLPRDQATAISNAVRGSPSEVDSVSDTSFSPILKARDKPEEQQPSPSTRKRVTFDSNVKTYELEHVEAEAETDVLFEKGAIDEERELAEITQRKSQSEDNSTVSSISSYPTNHRYRHCRDSDDDDEELDYADSDLDHEHIDTDDDDNDYDDMEDEEYDNFSDDENGKSSAQVFADEVDSCLSVCGCPGKTGPQTGVRPTARDRNACVLKPVENISQWKEVKVKDKHKSNPHHKENLAINEAPRNSFGKEPSLKELSFGYKSKTFQPKNSDQGIAVDASLSNWLSSSEVTPPPSKTSKSISSSLLTPESQGSNSPKNLEDRPILGALTMEEIKQFSTSPSPRRSPHRGPNEIPIIGTVGTYWSHSGFVEKCK